MLHNTKCLDYSVMIRDFGGGIGILFKVRIIY